LKPSLFWQVLASSGRLVRARSPGLRPSRPPGGELRRAAFAPASGHQIAAASSRGADNKRWRISASPSWPPQLARHRRPCERFPDRHCGVLKGSEPSSNSVRLARTIIGALKSGTPLAIASTPVSALHPAENALSPRRMLTGSKPRVASSKRSPERCGWWSRPQRAADTNDVRGAQQDVPHHRCPP